MAEQEDCLIPYNFEPELESGDDQQSSSDSSSDVQSIVNRLESDDEDINVAGTRNWCRCGMCPPQINPVEEICCLSHNQERVQEKMTQQVVNCITQHTGFTTVCLDIDVLETAFFAYCQKSHDRPGNRDIHRKYRYVAYRQFARWIYHYLGKDDRRVLPACAVSAIRTQFQSETYTGFKYARF